MKCYAELLGYGLANAGHEVRCVRPPALLGRLWSGEKGIGKWIGYIDRFILYPVWLRYQARWAEVVHICDQANAVYIPHLGHKPHVVTCHDMLAIRAAQGEIPESRPGQTGRLYQRWILRNLRKSRYAACVSRQTLDELHRIAGLSNEQTRVVPNALNHPYRPMDENEAQARISGLKLDPGKPFFMHVGGNQWYKNRMGVVRIFSELKQYGAYENHDLVMAGKPWPDDLRRLVAERGLQDCVKERVAVDNEGLRALYSSASALLFPSLQEGFGWPIVEAQACGCPVITTERKPMTDVGGAAAIYIDPKDEKDAARKAAATLFEKEKRRAAGIENAARFTLDSMIEGYIDLYRRAMRSRTHG